MKIIRKTASHDNNYYLCRPETVACAVSEMRAQKVDSNVELVDGLRGMSTSKYVLVSRNFDTEYYSVLSM